MVKFLESYDRELEKNRTKLVAQFAEERRGEGRSVSTAGRLGERISAPRGFGKR
jgi:hypothetical protein